MMTKRPGGHSALRPLPYPLRRRGGPADGTRHGPGSPFAAAQASTASSSKSWTFTPRSTAYSLSDFLPTGCR